MLLGWFNKGLMASAGVFWLKLCYYCSFRAPKNWRNDVAFRLLFKHSSCRPCRSWLSGTMEHHGPNLSSLSHACSTIVQHSYRYSSYKKKGHLLSTLSSFFLFLFSPFLPLHQAMHLLCCIFVQYAAGIQQDGHLFANGNLSFPLFLCCKISTQHVFILHSSARFPLGR